MIKIKTELFRKHKKTLMFFLEKGRQIAESICLNFQDKYAYVMTEGRKVRIRLDYEGEVLPTIFVKADVFFILCEKYEELVYDGEKFLQETDTYKLESFKRDVDFQFNEHTQKVADANVEITSELKQKMLKAMSYVMVEDPRGDKYALFFQEEYLIAMHMFSRCYETKLNMGLPHFNISYDIAKLLTSISDKEKVVLSAYEEKEVEGEEKAVQDLYGYVYINIEEGECETIIYKNSKYMLPSLQTEKFKARYNHEHKITVNRIELLDVINFLLPFLKDVDNQRIRLTVEAESLLFEIAEESTNIKKHVPLESVSEELIGNLYWFNLSALKILIGTFKDELITLQMQDKQGQEVPSIMNLQSKEEEAHAFVLELR